MANGSDSKKAFQEPPYIISVKTADYLTKIAENVARLEFGTEFRRDIKLHRKNRVRSIHSSLAIEGNTLSLDEVTAVIEGKLVAGKQAEIKEVKNAYEAYDKILTFDPYNVKDFLKAHKLMMSGLVKESGMFRSGDAGVFDGDIVVHIGARPQFVPELIDNLFGWAKESELHPLLKSSILHCEIETIHPFADGNGRMGRLWQTVLLAKWNALFGWIPVESLVYEKRDEYYQALADAQSKNDTGVFIQFALSSILDIVMAQEKHQVRHEDKHQVELSDKHLAVLQTLKLGSLSRKEIFSAIGMSGDTRSFKRNIDPLIKSGFIEMTVPDKPNSRLQRYRLTDKGRECI